MYLLIVSKKIDHSSSTDCANRNLACDGTISIQILSLNGMVVVPEDSLGWGFAFAFDLAAITSELAGTCFLFLWTCKTLSVVLDVIVHITNCSVGNSDPRLRIVSSFIGLEFSLQLQI